MGKFMCECGNVISDTAMPCDELKVLISSSMVMDHPEKIEDEWTELPEIWECPECKGLTRFDNSAYRTCYYKRIDDEKASGIS